MCDRPSGGYLGTAGRGSIVASTDPFDDFDDDDFDDEFDDDFEEEWDDELPGDEDQFEPDDEEATKTPRSATIRTSTTSE